MSADDVLRVANIACAALILAGLVVARRWFSEQPRHVRLLLLALAVLVLSVALAAAAYLVTNIVLVSVALRLVGLAFCLVGIILLLLHLRKERS